MQPELTLIVAATRSLGIGRNGTMPWPSLRKEMQYFARVTSRTVSETPNAINAVIMGRKTWDSIPPRFRPLRNRLNIVISRTKGPEGEAPQDENQPRQHQDQPQQQHQPIRVPSLDAALAHVANDPLVSRVFVMGGGQIYEQALRRPESKRVLLTRIENEYECDTFFGLDLRDGTDGWRRCSAGEWRAWTGECERDGEGESVEEAGVRYQWQMWER
ncbi:hypothetical protein E4U42_005826 [Claviceps africana]|uniref:Dihydrofolate reductase n=1 Tax=Claviceps africana TaxID=83212 RepID=A0A8K0JCX4_9HYPO|nr:hypothetical protein E4U42_005826 [Claviceps africana]